MKHRWLWFVIFIAVSSLRAQLPETGKVVLYSVKRAGAGGVGYAVWVDERKALELAPGHRAVAQLPTGKHTFRAAAKGYTVTIDIERDRTYYLRYDFVVGGFAGAKILTQVAVDTGATQCERTKPSKPSRFLEPALFVVE